MSGAIVWFTGLPSSGKSHLARRVRARLDHERRSNCTLDGDAIRKLIRPEPGYTPSERDDFYLTLGGLAVELSQQGLVVLVPATARCRAYRDRARALSTRFIEVWLTTSLEECRARDDKGLYARFSVGAVQGLPGEDQAYEAPEFPEVRAKGGEDDDALSLILRLLHASPPAKKG